MAAIIYNARRVRHIHLRAAVGFRVTSRQAGPNPLSKRYSDYAPRQSTSHTFRYNPFFLQSI
jgi:hypothetical protein